MYTACHVFLFVQPSHLRECTYMYTVHFFFFFFSKYRWHVKKKTHTHKYMTYEVYKMYEGGHILKRVVYDLLRIEYNIS